MDRIRPRDDESSCQVKRELLERIREIEKILDDLISLIDNARIVPRTSTYIDVVTLAIISKSIAVGRAVCLLIQSGFPEEAFGLTRTLIELSFTLRWITNRESKKRAARFLNYFWNDRT